MFDTPDALFDRAADVETKPNQQQQQKQPDPSRWPKGDPEITLQSIHLTADTKKASSFRLRLRPRHWIKQQTPNRLTPSTMDYGGSLYQTEGSLKMRQMWWR
jgi:hypothetical protein